ncbi:MAG: DUF6722 family protein [Elusimicrobiota bacterium]
MLYIGMNPEQRKSLAKYSYDLSKVIFTLAILNKIFGEREINPGLFIKGVIAAMFFLVIGYLIEGGKQT